MERPEQMTDLDEHEAALDAAADAVDLARVSRAALEALARAVLRWDAGPGFPGGPVADAIDRIKSEGQSKL